MTALRQTLVALLVGTVAAVGSVQADDTYPKRPVRMVVGFSAGGGPDVFARLVAQKMAEALGEQFVVENKTGAGGTIAADYVAKSQPDGYTLLVGDSATLMINSYLQSNNGFDPSRDLTPLARGVVVPMWLVVHPSVSANSVKELIALAKSAARPLPYASSGSGTIIHIVMEQFKAVSGADFLHVPFKGTGQSVPALLSGDVLLGFVGYPTIRQSIKAGRLKVLAVSTATRSDLTPEIPTVSESGYPGFDVAASLGVFAPAGLPSSLAVKLNTALQSSLEAKDAVERLNALGMEPRRASLEQLPAMLAAERRQYGELIKRIGLKTE